mmetsp:Transcript_125238/g.359689  ORF Transcript_125238/g.359689 Transcript_125238/m.359689 type:complete len:194 (-) Transcript_125238:7-588(-)
MTGFWEYRHEQEQLGKANGVQPFSTKAFYAGLQGVTAGLVYGTLYWAYYPDKFVFSHKKTVEPGPSRGRLWVQHTVLRPMVIFSSVTLTFAGVESWLEEVRGSHHKDPWNAAGAGMAAGAVLGMFTTRRFDIAFTTGLGLSLLMGAVEFNGSSIICDPETETAKKFPPTLPRKFEESTTLKELKEVYPAYKEN